jgi:hypothetical protein
VNPLTRDPNRRSLPLGQWPEPDRLAWVAATRRRSGLFSQEGLASEWAEPTRTSVYRSYARWIGFLQRDGRLDPAAGPAARCTAENLDAYLAHLRACGNVRTTIVKRFGHLAMALQVMVPGFDTSFITRPGGLDLARRLPDDSREKPVFDSRILLDHAVALFEAGIAMRSDARRRTAVRDAVLLAVLATCAPRRRSLAAIEIGVQLTCTGEGYALNLRPRDMKQSNQLGYGLLPALTPMLDRYLQVERRELLGMAGHDRLWVSSRGTPMACGSITAAVYGRTKRLLGEGIRTHAFRRCLTTTGVYTSPEVALDAPAVLGHSPAVSLRHYNRATAVAAVARHGARMAERARRLMPLAASAYGWREERGEG